MGLAGSAPGEKLVKIYTCCRYGPDWAQWRQINGHYPDDVNEATIDLGLDAKLKITSLTGDCLNNKGQTMMLEAQLSDGTIWGPHGHIYTTKSDASPSSQRPSPSSPPLVLSHLSGDETHDAWILRFHWRPQ